MPTSLLMFALLALTACQADKIVNPDDPGGDGQDGGSMTISPASATLQTGDVLQLRIPAIAAQPFLPQYAPSWSSSDPEVVRVSAAGEVTAGHPGTATVTATLRQQTGKALITVVERGR